MCTCGLFLSICDTPIMQYCSHSAEKETEAQRSKVAFLRSHSWHEKPWEEANLPKRSAGFFSLGLTQGETLALSSSCIYKR